MTHATSASGVTTDTQPVDAGSNPKKRKIEYVEKATPFILDATKTLEEDLAKMEKMKREYFDFCQAIKMKYGKYAYEYHEGPGDILPEEITKLNDDPRGLYHMHNKHKSVTDYHLAWDTYETKSKKLRLYPISEDEAVERLD